MTTRLLLMATALSVSGCYRGGPGMADDADDIPPGRVPADGGDADGDDDGADDGEPGHQGEGDADDPPGRNIRRMSATQFHQSLTTVTGQAWPEFEDYAGAMGKADFAEITVEGRELSVTFDKFIHDAAMYSCTEAISADSAEPGPGEPASEGVILRHA
ncbi:MAG: hypothetical protein K0V04_10215, partial [Deltaproteobacteria bacterium]|nr:hypothetical protein [Deltaproteobacteria bacterium]